MARVIEEVIQVQDEFYILSTSSRVDDRTHVLKHGDTFAVFDRFGDFELWGKGELGLYHQDTRFLSRLTVRLGPARPLLLSSIVNRDNTQLTVDLANPPVLHDGEVVVRRGTVHVFRSAVIWDAASHHRLRIHNYELAPVEMKLVLEFDADFADLFEVRGIKRERRGTRYPPEASMQELVFRYDGLDGLTRRTTITFATEPSHIEGAKVTFDLHLQPGEDQTCAFVVRCATEAVPESSPPGVALSESNAPLLSFEKAVEKVTHALHATRDFEPDVTTSNRQFNEWMGRSIADLHMMRTDTAYGPYPYAGVPWFSTVFGRDGIISALECLWFDPAMARGVLAYLAATQATDEIPEKDSQPGKILHEARGGEMSALGEVPFSRYYGSTDATPLFIILADAYLERTGDLEFAKGIWPNVQRALTWIDTHGDIDGDGFVEYARRTKRGLLNQGWKDSHDAVFHANGELAEGPIALCEVQGYVYAARRAAANLAQRLGETGTADRLTTQAEDIRKAFEETFWSEELGTYVFALDGDKRPCEIRTSNAGHCLWVGIASAERAARVASTLLEPASFSGWGIRTVASGIRRYNPMAYHNGSIWPHDNALVAAGFARYGLMGEAETVFKAMYDASLFFALHRLPELFCGFRRRPGESPTQYPVSCSPQTWASASVFLLQASMVGLRIDGAKSEVVFATPTLPAFLPEVRLTGLRVGAGRVDLELIRHERDVGVNVLERDSDIRVVVMK